MRILGQLGLIFAFVYFGVWLSRTLPVGLPASIFGMLLLLAALRLRLFPESFWLKPASFLAPTWLFSFSHPPWTSWNSIRWSARFSRLFC